MRYEYIEPFVAATMKVLDSVVQCDIAKGDFSLVGADRLDGDVLIVIDLEGDSWGHVVVNMEKETALKIASVMAGDGFEGLASPTIDCISELANMIAGNAAGALNDLGFDINVSTPFVARRDDFLGRTGLELLQIPLFTDCGEITVNVALSAN